MSFVNDEDITKSILAGISITDIVYSSVLSFSSALASSSVSGIMLKTLK